MEVTAWRPPSGDFFHEQFHGIYMILAPVNKALVLKFSFTQQRSLPHKELKRHIDPKNFLEVQPLLGWGYKNGDAEK